MFLITEPNYLTLLPALTPGSGVEKAIVLFVLARENAALHANPLYYNGPR